MKIQTFERFDDENASSMCSHRIYHGNLVEVRKGNYNQYPHSLGIITFYLSKFNIEVITEKENIIEEALKIIKSVEVYEIKDGLLFALIIPLINPLIVIDTLSSAYDEGFNVGYKKGVECIRKQIRDVFGVD
jgi:hypothetical protein